MVPPTVGWACLPTFLSNLRQSLTDIASDQSELNQSSLFSGKSVVSRWQYKLSSTAGKNSKSKLYSYLPSPQGGGGRLIPNVDTTFLTKTVPIFLPLLLEKPAGSPELRNKGFTPIWVRMMCLCVCMHECAEVDGCLVSSWCSPLQLGWPTSSWIGRPHHSERCVTTPGFSCRR